MYDFQAKLQTIKVVNIETLIERATSSLLADGTLKMLEWKERKKGRKVMRSNAYVICQFSRRRSLSRLCARADDER